MKKNRNESRDEGVGKRADEEKKKNAIRTLRATRKEKKEKENERNKEKEKKKRLKRKKSTKVGIHIPHPPALEYKKKKKFFLD